MKRVLVLGDGVIGTTSAWYLARAGFEVTVVDRQPQPASETSYANAGQLSFGYTSPWAAPGVPLKAFKWLFQQHSPLRVRPDFSLAQLRFLWAMYVNCDADRYARNKSRMVRLSQYSGKCLAELRAETGIEYEGRQLGTVQLFRTQQQLDAATKDVAVLASFGVPYELLDPAGIVRAEPALASAPAKLVGALRTPGDETGDCRLFTRRLAEMAARQGAEFRHGVNIESLETDGERITGVIVEGKRETADAYVVALGSHAPHLLTPLGIRLPVYPLKGYSLTVPITNEAMAPVSTILDESYKVAITRFDQRIRVGGMAEVAGFDLSLPRNRRETLEMVVNQLYPNGGDLPQAEFWSGLRPATPDGTPVVGATRLRNLWLNSGHGTLGWTMSCGSARYLADLIGGRVPQIDTEGLDISRYSRRAAAPAKENLACVPPAH